MLRYLCRVILSSLVLFHVAETTACAAVSAFEVTSGKEPPSILIPAVHIPDPGVTLPAQALFAHKNAFLSEGFDPSIKVNLSDYEIGPQVKQTSFVLGRITTATWTEGLDMKRLEDLLKRHGACMPGVQTADLSNLAQSVLAMTTARAAATLIETPCPIPAGLKARDDVVRAEALKAGIKTTWLETPENWKAVQMAIPTEAWRDMLLNDLKGNTLDSINDRVVQDTNSGNFDDLAAISTDQIKTPAMEHYRSLMLGQRTHTMVAAAEPFLRKGGAVVLMGGAHFGGPLGAVTLLRKDGFTVRPVLIPEQSAAQANHH